MSLFDEVQTFPEYSKFSPEQKRSALSMALDEDLKVSPGYSEADPSKIETEKNLFLDDYLSKPVKGVGFLDTVSEGAKGIARGVVDVAQTVPELADFALNMLGAQDIREEYTKPFLAKMDALKENDAIGMSESAKASTYTDPEWWTSRGGQALPTLLSMFIPVAAASKLATAGKGFQALTKAQKAAKVAKYGTVAGAAGGVGLEGAFAHSGFRQYAEQNPDDPNVTAMNDFVATVGTGVFAGGLEALSGMAFFNRMFPGQGGKVAGKLWKRLSTEVPKGVLQEGGTEAVQEVIGNFFTSMGYEPDQELTEGAFESFLIGGLLGGGMSTVASAKRPEAMDTAQPPPPIDIETTIGNLESALYSDQVTPEEVMGDMASFVEAGIPAEKLSEILNAHADDSLLGELEKSLNDPGLDDNSLMVGVPPHLKERADSVLERIVQERKVKNIDAILAADSIDELTNIALSTTDKTDILARWTGPPETAEEIAGRIATQPETALESKVAERTKKQAELEETFADLKPVEKAKTIIRPGKDKFQAVTEREPATVIFGRKSGGNFKGEKSAEVALTSRIKTDKSRDVETDKYNYSVVPAIEGEGYQIRREVKTGGEVQKDMDIVQSDRDKDILKETPTDTAEDPGPDKVDEEKERPKHAVTEIIPPDGRVNGITRKKMGQMLSDGDEKVLEDIKHGVAEHGLKAMEDTVRNEIMRQVSAAKKGPDRDAVRVNVAKLQDRIDLALKPSGGADTVKKVDQKISAEKVVADFNKKNKTDITFDGVQEIPGQDPIYMFTDRGEGPTGGTTFATRSPDIDSIKKSYESRVADFSKKADLPSVETETAPLEGEAGKYPGAKKTVDGRIVRTAIPNISSIGASIEGGEELSGVREVKMASFTLDEAPLATDKRTLALAEEIKNSGEINPLIVGVDEKGPYILEGGHRYDALKILGAKAFPAVVVIEDGAITSPQPAPSQDVGEAKPTTPKSNLPTLDKISGNLEIIMPTRIEETGKVVSVKYNAKAELSEAREDVNRWQKLLDCLKS
ncbi:ParB-like nuclease domain-containing protein [Candidatus Pacearchaeota archaeon]|nr:ParB-like nuclease domain-containing protein [Candidatus Pacearchaeota archaeon]